MLAHICILFYVVSFITERSFYPVKAVAYLQQHPPARHIFSSQEWNGYLVWKLPGERVFIHGMMPSWRNHAVKNESPYAFVEYMDIILGKIPFSKTTEAYGIDTVMLPSQPRQPKPSQTPKKKENKNYYGQLLANLEQTGWEKVFEDKIAVIYVKK